MAGFVGDVLARDGGASEQVVVALNGRGYAILASHSLSTRLEREAVDVIGCHWSELVHPSDHPTVDAGPSDEDETGGEQHLRLLGARGWLPFRLLRRVRSEETGTTLLTLASV